MASSASPTIRLHGYWRSGTTYRTRIALNLKGLDWEAVPVNLPDGAQHGAEYRRLQPQGLVPALEVDGLVLTQSPAILEWIEERFPEPALLPADATERAVVRAMAAAIACDIHPLHNLRVFRQMKKRFGANDAATESWSAHWIAEGFAALEQLIARHGRGFAFGDRPTLADCYLVPQVYSADRFNVDLSPYPRVVEAARTARALDPVARAHPTVQPDAPV